MVKFGLNNCALRLFEIREEPASIVDEDHIVRAITRVGATVATNWAIIELYADVSVSV